MIKLVADVKNWRYKCFTVEYWDTLWVGKLELPQCRLKLKFPLIPKFDKVLKSHGTFFL